MKTIAIATVLMLGCGKGDGGVSAKDAKKAALAAVRAGDFAKLEPMLWSPERMPAKCRRDGDKEKAAALRATARERLAACKAIDWDAALVLEDETGGEVGEAIGGLPEGCDLKRVSDVTMLLELGKDQVEVHALSDAFQVGSRVLAFGPPSCAKPDPVAKWIAKLDEPVSFDEAVTALERLEDKRAIAPLAAAWRSHHRLPAPLQAIVAIAAAVGWDEATPILIEHLETFDDTLPAHVSQALMACEALGAAGAKDAIPVLTTIAEKKYEEGSPGSNVQRAAVAALERLRPPPAAPQP